MPLRPLFFAASLLALLLFPGWAFPGPSPPRETAAERDAGVADRLARIERAMWERNADAIPALREWAARDGSEKVRERAVGALTLLRDAGAPGIFLDRLSADPSPRVRRAAADAVGTLGILVERDDRLTGLLRKDPDAMVRAEIARALGRIGARQAAGNLIYAVAIDPAPEVRALAAEALSLMRADDAGEVLKAASLRDSSPLVRLAAVRALQHLLPKESQEVFRALWLEAADPDLRREAFRGLLLARETGEWIRLGLAEKDPAVRLLAFRAWLTGLDLARRRERFPRQSLEVLRMEEFLRDPSGGIRELARGALEVQGYKVRENGFSYAIVGE